MKDNHFLGQGFPESELVVPNSTTFEVAEPQQKSWLAHVIGNCIMAYCYNPHTGPVPFPHLQALSSSSPVSPGGKNSREPQEWEPIFNATGPIRIIWKIGEWYGNPAAYGKGQLTPILKVFMRMVRLTLPS